MNERDALYRHICEHPDDDTARLVFADWLQEHSEVHRAEFIRVQCRLASLPPTAPEVIDLRIRERILAAGRLAGWREELPILAGLEWDRGGSFVRGFPTNVFLR